MRSSSRCRTTGCRTSNGPASVCAGRWRRHVAYYDRPGHYLRISILFDRPFWRHLIAGSWVMLDAFGGCCVYDEGPPRTLATYGVLGWLLAGADALSSCNVDDRTLIARALESLPDELYDEARRRIIEGKVHRWAGAVSGQPGGYPVARRELGTSAGAGRASGTGRGRRLPVRFDAERRASLRTNRDRPAARRLRSGDRCRCVVIASSCPCSRSAARSHTPHTRPCLTTLRARS